MCYYFSMAIARFEKVSEKQFSKDLDAQGFSANYEDIIIPKRATKGSAGYDFYLPFDVTIKPGEMVKIPSGIRCFIESEYVLEIFPRSSLGFKYQLCLANTVGIIDADYYGADNEGHIIVALVNRGNKEVELKKGDRFVQGVFVKYYLAVEEEIDKVRTGGFGSTN